MYIGLEVRGIIVDYLEIVSYLYGWSSIYYGEGIGMRGMVGRDFVVLERFIRYVNM